MARAHHFQRNLIAHDSMTGTKYDSESPLAENLDKVEAVDLTQIVQMHVHAASLPQCAPNSGRYRELRAREVVQSHPLEVR